MPPHEAAPRSPATSRVVWLYHFFIIFFLNFFSFSSFPGESLGPAAESSHHRNSKIQKIQKYSKKFKKLQKTSKIKKFTQTLAALDRRKIAFSHWALKNWKKKTFSKSRETTSVTALASGADSTGGRPDAADVLYCRALCVYERTARAGCVLPRADNAPLLLGQSGTRFKSTRIINRWWRFEICWLFHVNGAARWMHSVASQVVIILLSLRQRSFTVNKWPGFSRWILENLTRFFYIFHKLKRYHEILHRAHCSKFRVIAF